MGRVGRRSRQLESAAVTAFLPVAALVPFWLMSLALLWLPSRLVWDIPFWVLPAAWLGLGALLFVRPVQVAVLTPLLGARRPDPRELDIIGPVWNSLANRNDLRPEHFVVRILPSDELNAFACGGHLVVVTSFAVERLSRPELAGVLAHELSHHLGMHTVALTLGHWLSLPIVLFARIGLFLQNVARAATDNFAAHSAALTAIGRLIGAVLTAISWVFLAALYASDALANLVGHSSEFEADRRAVGMGYGRQLAGALRRVISAGGATRTIGWRARLAASHPPARTRVARIEAIMRHPSGP
ncbi:MAG: M48 family metalloprotease [Ilumatobacteraceae bacterium]